MGYDCYEKKNRSLRNIIAVILFSVAVFGVNHDIVNSKMEVNRKKNLKITLKLSIDKIIKVDG